MRRPSRFSYGWNARFDFVSYAIFPTIHLVLRHLISSSRHHYFLLFMQSLIGKTGLILFVRIQRAKLSSGITTLFQVAKDAENNIADAGWCHLMFILVSWLWIKFIYLLCSYHMQSPPIIKIFQVCKEQQGHEPPLSSPARPRNSFQYLLCRHLKLPSRPSSSAWI